MFRVGQKVECVDDRDSHMGPTSVRIGIVYTVLASYIAPDGEPAVSLVEAKPARATVGFYASRFRPIVERKTDISFAHKILRKASRRVDA